MFRTSLIVLVAVGAALAVWTWAARPGASDTPSLAGKAAPDFSLKTLDDRTVKLSDQKGSVVVLDFWATWCGPCRLSLPHIQELSVDKDRAAKGLVVWAVNAREDAAWIQPYMASNKFTFTVPRDVTGAVLQSYQVEGIPTTVIVGRDGTVKSVFVGFANDGGKQIDAAVDKALGETK
jgi:thiol-disulfide isomerase/thioredoxin